MTIAGPRTIVNCSGSRIAAIAKEISARGWSEHCGHQMLVFIATEIA